MEEERDNHLVEELLVDMCVAVVPYDGDREQACESLQAFLCSLPQNADTC